jgi:hypothetical protein
MSATDWHTLGDLVACLFDALAPVYGDKAASDAVALLMERGTFAGDLS